MHQTISDLKQMISNDYGYAVLELAYLYNKQQKTSSLVFGFIEFLPKEYCFDFEQKISCLDKSNQLKFSDNETIYYMRDIFINASDALSAYENIFIESKINYKSIDIKAPLVIVNNYQIPSQYIAYPVDMTQSFPFISNRLTNVRVHSTYSETNKYLLHNDKAIQWLSEKFSTDFKEFPIIIGSFHCLFADPIFRRVEMKLSKDCDRTVEMQFILREGVSFDGLSLICEESNALGITNFHTVNLGKPEYSFKSNDEIQKISFLVLCRKRGVIARQEPVPFLKSIFTNIGIVTGTKNVEVPAKGKKRSEKYTSNIVSKGLEMLIGENKPETDIHAQLHQHQSNYLKKKNASELEQIWFNGNSDEAKEVIRKIMKQARKEVWFVDPYFTAREFYSFALAIENNEVKINILTSDEVLKHQSRNPSYTEKELLKKEIENLHGKLSNTIQIKLMTGKAVIHDRFLIVDENIWLSGMSLNEIGERAGMLIKLPDPERIIQNIETLWEKKVDKNGNICVKDF